ncbi:MAG: type II toxin-antitoxin system RelE/ParE family toxin [Deltaproteobacteria bacterium]|nr:type II toxin-antitoxin system RelE/ParE family toxin [Deltaproteobacteria bacterium]
MTEIREFQTDEGDAPFADWFDGLSARGANRVMIALGRMRQGNLGDHKGVGRGLFEHRVHDGPGYRIDFGKDGTKLIIFLGGGTNKRQQRNIEAARQLWKRYKDTRRRAK